MKQFWKYTLATVVGSVVTFGVLIAIFFVFISVLIAGFGDSEVDVKDKSVIRISLTGDIPDRTSDNPFDNFDFINMESHKALGLNDILKTIEKAKEDDRIKGIYLNLSVIPAGFASVEEIRNKLIEFKETEKFIICYSDIYTQKAYYLASVADEIYLNPQGGFDWKGLSSQIMFFKGALEKLGVEMQIFRYGEFKSAIEPFTEEKMSESNRLQMEVLMQSIWDEMVGKISKKRNISVEDLNAFADDLLVYNAETAVKKKMIDGALYYDEFLKILKEKTGVEEDAKPSDYIISLNKYKDAKVDGIKRNRAEDKVAVVFAEGEIVMGAGKTGSIGGDGLARTIRETRLDDDIKAVVLRVNSPGGSGLASEIIWREMVLTAKEKPVVVSMGNLAASGGYYIACPAHFIYAQPNTITGSIGVFGMLPNVETLMNEKLGITVDGVTTNKNSDIGSIMRPMEDSEREFIQKQVNDFYDVFLTRVSDARENLSYDDVDAIGEGRVWTGVTSLELGLVDGIGGINDAVLKAVELAELEEYRIVEYPEKKDFMEKLLSDFSVKAKQSIVEQTLGHNYKVFQILERVNSMEGIQARMPFEIVIQ